MTIVDFERELDEARKEMARAAAALRRKHGARASAEFFAAGDRVLRAERALSEARGEEHAVPCAGFPAWDVGAPLPQLVTGHGKALLVYHTRERDPTWDGRTAHMVDANELHLVAIVRFQRVVSVRMGAPNDEVLHGHPLFGKGLAAYEAHVVMRSSWVSELCRINAVHSRYNPQQWDRYRHYLLSFHDETFECVAESFTATTSLTTLQSACRDALDDLPR